MLRGHKPQVSVSTALLSSPKLSGVFTITPTEKMFSISFNSDYQNVDSLCSRHHYINSLSGAYLEGGSFLRGAPPP